MPKLDPLDPAVGPMRPKVGSSRPGVDFPKHVHSLLSLNVNSERLQYLIFGLKMDPPGSERGEFHSSPHGCATVYICAFIEQTRYSASPTTLE